MDKIMKILIVDDEADIRESLTEILEEEGYAVAVAANAAAAYEKTADDADLVMLDIKLGEDNGIDVLKKIKKLYPSLPVVMISGHGTVALASQAFKLGAYDFLEKPLRLMQVKTCVRNTLERLRLRRQLLMQGYGGRLPVYVSDGMTRLFGQAKKLAHIKEPVMILGPSGSGKELVARSLHYEGPRTDHPFVATNAASMPVNLAEDELFGHVKGAFTGADRDRAGCLEEADGGTLFLDEIADMDPQVQAKLLRVLEDGTFTRLGSTAPRKVNVRLVCATHKDIEKLVADGLFRQDLWFRINAFMLAVPPLADRPDDIPVLADHFLSLTIADMGITKRFTDGALNALGRLTLPGNVRELKHLVARLAVYSAGDNIDVNDVTALTAGGTGVPRSAAGGSLADYTDMDFKSAREAFEKDFLRTMLEKNDGNITATANAIGMAQSNLSRKLKELGLR